MLMHALSKTHEARIQMLENKIFDFALGFLFHKVADVRKLTVQILLEITCFEKSDFLMHTTMIDRLFKMLRRDNLEIREEILSLFVYRWEDHGIDKIKFWMEKDIIQEIEIMLLTETDKTHLFIIIELFMEVEAYG